MSTIQFILGRSGSGKTHYCLESIKTELIKSALGNPLILLVPEQATFQMEQALLADKQIEGYHRVRILSFERWARMVLAEAGRPGFPVLSEFGKQMILRRLLQQRQGELKIFHRVTDRSGFIKQLSRIISELRQYRQSPKHLNEQIEELLKKNDPALGPLVDKMADLTLIFQGYQDYIEGKFVDPDDYLDLATQRCREVDFLQGAYLWVDGFAGFTPQQYHALTALICTAEQTRISLCLYPGGEQFQVARDRLDEPLNMMDLFHPILQTYQRLGVMLQGDLADKVEHESVIILPAHQEAQTLLPRFEKSEGLAQLEQNFLRETTERKTDSGEFVEEVGETDMPVRDIVVVETQQRRREVETAAQHILRLCRDQGYRYREIAVILRDFGDYQDLIEAVFADYGIAYFIDRRHSVHHHPLIMLLRGALSVLESNFHTEHVIYYLKSDLVPVLRETVDALENYCLARGIQGKDWWDSQHWSNQQNNEDKGAESRSRVLKPLLQMREKIYGKEYQPEKKFPVREITIGVVELLERLKVAETLNQWYSEELEQGQLDQAQVHEQIYNDLMHLFDDIVTALGDCSVTLNEYNEILCGALQQMTLRLVPPGLDQVLVGTIERSRHPQIRAAFVLGVNEKKFPQLSVPDAFFTDPQREQLRQSGFELGPASTEKLLQERYLAYIALTRPREFLWVSYALADEKGNKLNPSSFIEDIYEAVDRVRLVRLTEDLGKPNLHQIATSGQLTVQLARALSISSKNSEQIDPVWGQLYSYACSQEVWSKKLQQGLAGITYNNRAELKPTIVDHLYANELASSVSRLETYAACPFQYFARFILRIEPREELQLTAPDMGSLYHNVLYKIFLNMNKQGLDWRDLTNENIRQIVDEEIELVIRHDQTFTGLREKSSRNKFLLAEAAKRLELFCRSLRAGAKAGEFYQREGELEFGPKSPLAAPEIELGLGKKLLLRGKIDRVDVCLKEDGKAGLSITDYKSTARPFNFTQFYHGLALQLVSYLLALKNYQPAQTETTVQTDLAAALYLPVWQSGKSHDESPPEEVLSGKFGLEDKPHKASGIFSREWLGQLDKEVQPKEWSAYFKFRLTKDGSISDVKRSGVLEPEEMELLLAHCREMLGQFANEILSGKIEVRPYRLENKQTPCSRCDYHSFCRFDPNHDNYRQLASHSKPEVLEKIKAT